MKYKRQYETKVDRDRIVSENSELRLIEEQNLLDGNFLVFTDEPEPPAVEPPRPMIIMTEQEYLALVGNKP